MLSFAKSLHWFLKVEIDVCWHLVFSISGQVKATCCSFSSLEHRIQSLDLNPALFGALFPRPAQLSLNSAIIDSCF